MRHRLVHFFKKKILGPWVEAELCSKGQECGGLFGEQQTAGLVPDLFVCDECLSIESELGLLSD